VREARGVFTLEDETIALPTGAFACTRRRTLRHGDRKVLAMTQGRARPYLYPLYTPLGFAVTEESPADHPHHNSVWIGADHVHCRMPVGEDRHEDYTYNFYVDEVFQGRAPGRLVETGCRHETLPNGGIRTVQRIEWRGPVEWAAPEGRLAARETRVLTVSATDGGWVIDIDSTLAAAEWAFTLGPTRHAYFNVRVADSMTAANGGIIRDDRGRKGGIAVSGEGARWVSVSGSVGGDHRAGVALFPDPRDHAEPSWFVADWGVVTVGPFRNAARLVASDAPFRARYRLLVHDGNAADFDPAAHHAAWVTRLETEDRDA
jgi:hypothetical protein